MRGGEVEGKDQYDVSLGETVQIELTADTRDEIHVHGYDLTRDVRPGKTARLRFTADIPGAFEVELEESGTELFELRVQ